MTKQWFAVDAVFGEDREVHSIIPWHELQELLKQIVEEGDLEYLEIDETTKPKH